ncbi:sigma-54 dependent transcriptional regulator [Lutimaribacter sp. EGI FJ00015]|uniref:Sigma-54 dependent transcriptional regulator n=1 Tax=Lutimaribacter degradans TaxID=2945989 RepID=A0ACC5ZYS9_9RHOB|nr:sigma-54 dependent transcriptional regulator [Lutimaribacter sp. EGI FJ00013]MCM2563335.1 sigma-54 dependent transcriptional regulator [Lutimaribacter sp. EGI FJ00013]MCO0614587.1 sigma-54 dependent transcriptional regulator [Lutimaribacter sp. EGI FJ00015]MCO0637259.1 sigma-54 dependent transcriptional regulator [Lutimaribacter sp. EGI FJ00014]
MLRNRHIVLVEDDEIMGGSLLQRLELEGAQVLWLKQMVRALGAIRTPQKPIDAVICDIGLPDGSGEELFSTLVRTGTPPPFLFITGQGGIGQAVRLIKSGAADYVTKPFDMSVFLERLSLLVSDRDKPFADDDFPPLLGVSPAARKIEGLIAKAAGESHAALIRGGPGTGKDLVARRIHDLSDRSAAPFVAVNLAREADAEMALFGSDGAFEVVSEGTLFINAVSKMGAKAQSRLLERLDGRFEGRLIAACGNDLEDLIAQGRITSELFYRLAQTEIPIPPLNTRPDDAIWLMQQLFRKLAARHGPGIEGISVLCEDAVRAHDWPGGGRELRARLLRGLTMATGPLLQPSDLFPERLADPDEIMSLVEAREAAEKAQIIAALDRTGGQIGEAARLLRIARTTLWEKMQKLGLSGP